MLQTISWTNHAARLLDQTKLPAETTYVDITNEKQMHDAIRRLVIRGAPAIGVAAAYGVYLGIRDFKGPDLFPFYDHLNEVCDYLATSRPTAVNLFWAIDRIRRVAREAGRDSHRAQRPQDAIDLVKARILSECHEMLEEDTRVCKAIGEHGLKFIQELLRNRRRSHDGAGSRHSSLVTRPAAESPPADIDSTASFKLPTNAPPPIHVLTHCNAGGLATVQYGTALAPIYVGAEKGVSFHVWSDETRPLLQGSRITAYELRANNVPVTVICDSMAATVMGEGQVDLVIVGADRIAANGDVANKIGTLSVAILAKHFGIPFLVAAPTSTVDLATPTGREIPIEERNVDEISRGLGKQTAPDGVDIYNPAFDVTPADLVTAIITENGVVTAPYSEGLRHVCAKS